MLTTCCPLLDEQARRLRNLYDMQLSLMSRDGSGTELRAVEFELIRTHRAIKRHRVRCLQCKLSERFVTRPGIRLRPLPSEAPLLPVQVY
jgi:predicted MarR family transcription regulator